MFRGFYLNTHRSWSTRFEGPKTFTQDELNAILAKEAEKYKATQDKYAAEFEALKARADLTANERTELDKRLKALSTEHATREEQLTREVAELRRQMETETGKLKTDADRYKTMFTTHRVQSELTAAAAAGKAVNVGQIKALLEPRTELVESLDEKGVPTGEYVTRVKYETLDKDKKPIVLHLSPTDAIKRLREDEAHANLFQFEGNGGTGHRGAGGGKAIDMAEILRDPVKYREARANGTIE